MRLPRILETRGVTVAQCDGARGGCREILLVEGRRGGGDGDADAVERERRKESSERLVGGNEGVGREVEVVEIEEERDGEQGGGGEEEVSDAGSRSGDRKHGHFPASFHAVRGKG